MPYIDRRDRSPDLIPRQPASSANELAYALTMTCVQYLDFLPGEVGSSSMAEVIAALEAAKLEFYRRVVAPHEDRKVRENGDVYPAPLAKPGGRVG